MMYIPAPLQYNAEMAERASRPIERPSRPVEDSGHADTLPGLYGFSLLFEQPDMELVARMIPAPAHWPTLRVAQTVEGEMRPEREVRPEREMRPELQMDEDVAQIELGEGGAGLMRRQAGEAHFRTPAELTADELVHPMLGHAALAFAYWMGREVFHAGVFLCAGGAWALLGERGSGKSSTLAWLARNGQPIVADDLLVLDGHTAFTGPRTIDLAPASASHLGWEDELEQVRHGYRRRLTLRPLAGEHRLRGWVSLAWGEELSITLTPAAERIPLLIEHGHQPRGVANWPKILELASLPMFELRRPRRLESLAPAGELLLATLAGETESLAGTVESA
jgi:hypothetical protein